MHIKCIILPGGLQSDSVSVQVNKLLIHLILSNLIGQFKLVIVQFKLVIVQSAIMELVLLDGLIIAYFAKIITPHYSKL